jgi:hypothetical protein
MLGSAGYARRDRYRMPPQNRCSLSVLLEKVVYRAVGRVPDLPVQIIFFAGLERDLIQFVLVFGEPVPDVRPGGQPGPLVQAE